MAKNRELELLMGSAEAEIRRENKTTGCTSFIARRLGVGFNKAVQILDALEEEGVISPADDKGARQLLKRA